MSLSPLQHGQSELSTTDNEALRVFWVTLWLNLLVAAGKLMVGFSTGVLSLVADGFHAISDASANVVGIMAIKVGQKPPDANHPYGHRKFEALGAIIISFLLFLASWEVLKTAWERTQSVHDLSLTVNWLSYTVMALSMVISFGVSRYERKKGLALNNGLLVADAAHTMTDVYSSVSILIALALIQLGLGWMDLLMSVVVVGLIFKTGVDIIQEHIGPLVDETVIDPDIVEALVLQVAGVKGCRHIRSRGLAQQVFIDLTILVDAALSVREAHHIADAVEQHLGAQQQLFIVDVIVHIEEAEENAETNGLSAGSKNNTIANHY